MNWQAAVFENDADFAPESVGTPSRRATVRSARRSSLAADPVRYSPLMVLASQGNSESAPSMHSLDKETLQRVASRSLSSLPRPFLRWAGSKRVLLPHIVPALPESFGTYWEPFVGSGSLFFLLQPRRAVLSDTCAELIATFCAVRDDPERVMAWFAGKKPDRDLYYHLRENQNTDASIRAAEFIYLNRTCWNGLYRVNSDGKFNVPYGRPKTDNLIDANHLDACSRALAGVDLLVLDFDSVVADAEPGDLVFLDPPYVTGHNNNGFVDYNERLFSWADQERLAVTAHTLAERGVHVIATNANHRDIVALYHGFTVIELSRHSTLAATPSFRKKVSEVLLTSTSRSLHQRSSPHG